MHLTKNLSTSSSISYLTVYTSNVLRSLLSLFVCFALDILFRWTFLFHFIYPPLPPYTTMNCFFSLSLFSLQLYVYGWLLCNNRDGFLFLFFGTISADIYFYFFWFCYHLHTPFCVWLNEFVGDAVFVCCVAFQLSVSLSVSLSPFAYKSKWM